MEKRILETTEPIDTKCEWCEGTKIKAVKQGPYVHHICKNKKCAHEWDKVK